MGGREGVGGLFSSENSVRTCRGRATRGVKLTLRERMMGVKSGEARSSSQM